MKTDGSCAALQRTQDQGLTGKTNLDQLNSHHVVQRVWRLLAASQLVLECLPWDPSLIQLPSVAGVYLGNKGDEAVCVS